MLVRSYGAYHQAAWLEDLTVVAAFLQLSVAHSVDMAAMLLVLLQQLACLEDTT